MEEKKEKSVNRRAVGYLKEVNKARRNQEDWYYEFLSFLCVVFDKKAKDMDNYIKQAGDKYA